MGQAIILPMESTVSIDRKSYDALIESQHKLADCMAEIDRLREIVNYLTRKSYCPSADKLASNKLQLTLPLFNEAEASADVEPEASEPEDVPVHKRRKRGGRRKIPADLPSRDVMHDLTEEDKICSECHNPMTQIGENVSTQLEYQPAKLIAVRHHRPKYGCPQCECPPKQAKPAPSPIPKSMATASLLAHILVSKYIDALPLYRQERQWRRLGIDLSRALLSGWVLKSAELLNPLWGLMLDALRHSEIVQADETPLQVLKEPGRSAAQKSYMWLFQCGPPGSRIILYHYDPSRSSAVPNFVLGDQFRGYLQTDGYAGYHDVCTRDGVIGVGCFAHARRKFVDAAKQSRAPGLAHEAVAMIKRLYAIESAAKVCSPEERQAMRLNKAKPILDQFNEWLVRHQDGCLPKSLLGKAMSYARSEWPRLVRYLDDGRVDIDNNAAERSIKPFVIGRKNWLFSNTSSGAKASAVIYSLIRSAQANDIDPYQWLNYALAQLPLCSTDEQRKALLPYLINRELLDDAKPLNP